MHFATPTSCMECGRGRLESEVLSFTLGLSPVPELVGTNHTPSEFEADAIRDTIFGLQPSISALDNDIAQVQATLTELQRKRQVLHNYFQEHKSLLSSIRRFPEELLGEIFSHCLPERWQDRTLRRVKAPLILTQICRHWRAIAISTRKLWSSVVYESQSSSDIVFTKLWLARGGNCAMNVRISQPFVDSRLGTYIVQQVVGLLISHSERWRNLEIFLRPSMCSLIATVKDRLPILQSLAICAHGTFTDQSINAFERAPLLRSLNLSAPLYLLDIPWAQLDELMIDSANFGWAVAMLGHTANLTDFRLTSMVNCNPVPPGVIHNNQLRSLAIHFISIDAPGKLFDCLALPALQDVCIMQDKKRPLAPWICQEQLISLLSRSRCSLRRLAFHDVSLTDGELIECLEHAPSLVELELRDAASYSITNDALHRLIYRNPEDAQVACLAPALQVIELDAFNILNESLFMDMVQSRSRIGIESSDTMSQLKKVAISLRYADGQLEQVVFARARVRQLRDEGLDISVVQHFEGGSSFTL